MNMLAQLVQYGDKGDVVLLSAHSSQLEKYGWKVSTSNVPASYLVGYMLGVKAKGKNAILDLGLQSPRAGTRLYAVVKGAADAGLKIIFSEDAAPSADRVSGKHIVEYAKTNDKQFTKYQKNKVDPKKLNELFEEVKKNLSAVKK